MALIKGQDGRTRCWWPGHDPVYVRYHDEEWGLPVADDVRLYEKLCLEGFQAGLSWITILKRRESFRSAFKNFDIEKVAAFSNQDVQVLLKNDSIIRHRGKIEATVNNARTVLAVCEEFGSLASYLWRFAPESERPAPQTRTDIPAQTKESQALAKDLKKRGFKFLGPTTMYAFMQSMGFVNDHLEGCICRQNTEIVRKTFKRP